MTRCPPPHIWMRYREGRLSEKGTAKLRSHISECLGCAEIERDLAPVGAEKQDVPVKPPMQTPCVRSETWIRFRAGLLSKKSLARLREHVVECHDCAQLIADMVPEDKDHQPSRPKSLEPVEAKTETLWKPPKEFHGFRITGRLGAGAMGEVYAATDIGLERRVAIKFISSARQGQNLESRFDQESLSIARISHPNVAAVYQKGNIDGHPYLVTELIDGESLDTFRPPLPWKRVLRISIGLARGLAAIHRAPIIHRDIKPANIMVEKGGEVKYVDFGLAKPLDRSSPLTKDGTQVGTPRYWAPEVSQYEKATYQSDIYSVGVVLYELCTGRLPQEVAATQDVRHAASEYDPLQKVVPDIDHTFASIVDRCLRNDPAARFANGDALRDELEILDTIGQFPALPAGNPYQGLRPFEAEHRAVFHGRGSDVRAVLDLLRSDSLVLIIGDSGTGKSSLCRAGVLPHVQDGELGSKVSHSPVTLLPGRHPFKTLVTALTRLLGYHGNDEEVMVEAFIRNPRELCRRLRERTPNSALIFVDQAEELVTLADAEECHRFCEVVSWLANPISDTRILMTARADFLTSLYSLPELGDELRQPRTYVLRTMLPESIRDAVVRPALSKGVRFESEGLIQELVNFTAGATGGLPLLQFALAELWERVSIKKDCSEITTAALKELGGIEAALARHADRVVNHLGKDQQEVARRIMVHLISKDRTRNRRTLDEIEEITQGARPVLDALVNGRLLSTTEADGQRAYEIAHEALITDWAMLRNWLDADAGKRIIRERLTEAARQWENLNLPNDLLWGGFQLEELSEAGITDEDLSEREGRFLAASRRSVRRRRYARRGALALALMSMIAVLGAGYYFKENKRIIEIRKAEHVLKLAQHPGKAIDALVEAVDLVGGTLDRGRMPTPHVAAALFAAVRAAGPLVPPIPHGTEVKCAAYSRDGKYLIAVSAENLVSPLQEDITVAGAVRVFSAGNWSELNKIKFRRSKVTLDAICTPDGGHVVAWYKNGPVLLWEIRNSSIRQISEFAEVVDVDIKSVTISDDGAHVAIIHKDGTTRLWSALETGTNTRLSATVAVAFSPVENYMAIGYNDGIIKIFDKHNNIKGIKTVEQDDRLHNLTFSPNEKFIVGTTSNNIALVWRTDTEDTVTVLRGHTRPIRSVIFSPDSEKIITTSGDSTARLWDTSSGTTISLLRGNVSSVKSANFSPDGSFIATAGRDHTVRLWNSRSKYNSPLVILKGHKDGINSVAFSPDGRYLVSASDDSTVQIWDARLRTLDDDITETNMVLKDSKLIQSAQISPNGEKIVTGDGDGLVRIWDMNAKKVLRVLQDRPNASIRAVQFSHDGRRVLAASRDRSTKLWDTETGRLLLVLYHDGSVLSAKFSHNDRHIVTAGEDLTAKVWDSESGRLLFRTPLQAESVMGAAFSSDDERLATCGGDGNTRIWSMKTGSLIHVLEGHTDSVTSVDFSNDGNYIVTASMDNTSILWDARSYKPLSLLLEHQDIVNSAVFSSDSNFLATASADGTARLWHVPDSELLAVFRNHSDNVVMAEFSKDSGQLVTASMDQTVQLHGIKLKDYLRVACDRLHRWHRAPASCSK